MTRPVRYIDRRSSIARHLREIDELMLIADREPDLTTQNYLARLAVISLSGFLEKSIEHMVNGYLEENSSFRVLRFGQRQVQKFPNMNPTKLAELVGAFDADWQAQFEAFLGNDENRQTLGNLIGARHVLAHGGSTAVGMQRVRQYHEIAEKTAELLADWFLPLPT